MAEFVVRHLLADTAFLEPCFFTPHTVGAPLAVIFRRLPFVAESSYRRRRLPLEIFS